MSVDSDGASPLRWRMLCFTRPESAFGICLSRSTSCCRKGFAQVAIVLGSESVPPAVAGGSTVKIQNQ
jgi:hypothetical protein